MGSGEYHPLIGLPYMIGRNVGLTDGVPLELTGVAVVGCGSGVYPAFVVERFDILCWWFWWIIIAVF